MQRSPASFAPPEVQKQRRDPFADDSMEGLRANDINKVAKKDPPKASVLDAIKDRIAKVDISSMVNDMKNKLFGGDEQLPPAASAPSAGTAPAATAPVRVV